MCASGSADYVFAAKALERDYFMTAEEALQFGIVDKILESRPKLDV